LLTEASIDIPDPGASLTLITAINSAYGLGIETAELQASVERLNKELSALSDQFEKIQQQQQGGRPDKQLYG
jgi:predicted ATP-grasp superfamily ATP-dependent carboligase